ncbi:hypothetical protein V6N13_089405 [Hibiscus sabdariffa]|uniref:Uncharacterized protein n=1 Tax=Hibiscus sabdariffa TaxID=183260 RepID=A0ABR2NSQ9_9ROSI
MESKVARLNVVERVKSAQARIDQLSESGPMTSDSISGRSQTMGDLPRSPIVVGVENDPSNDVMSDSGDRLLDRLGGDQ